MVFILQLDDGYDEETDGPASLHHTKLSRAIHRPLLNYIA